MSEVTVNRVVATTADQLYALVSEVTAMGRWSPETTGCRWLGSATGPAIGARFRGNNRQGWRRWSTICTVTAAEPGRTFAFEVDFGPLPISRWRYDFEPGDDGCLVTETWTDRRPPWMIRVSPVVMGVKDRAGHNRAGMDTTLANLARAAEAATPA
jgi:hypothetical protein